jgi:hypothetical protein
MALDLQIPTSAITSYTTGFVHKMLRNADSCFAYEYADPHLAAGNVEINEKLIP